MKERDRIDESVRYENGLVLVSIISRRFNSVGFVAETVTSALPASQDVRNRS